MYLQTTFELALTLDAEKFNKILNRAYSKGELQPSSEDNKYVDNSLISKGITVTYRDSQYKKKVKLTVNPAWVLDSDELDPEKLVHKLEKHIDNYSHCKYTLNDFKLTGMTLITDIDVCERDKVSAYIKVLRRVGKVKGFSPLNHKWLDDNISFCLEGNSNGTEFMIYDLEGLLREQLKETEYRQKQLKAIIEKSEGLLRSEIRLTESKAIRAYTDKTTVSGQIEDLLEKSEKVFLDTFTLVVPFGDFHKKDKTVEIIKREVTDIPLRRRMLRLLELIPDKKSLLLAQKALNYRKVDDIMDMFAMIEVSPIAIGKRHDVKKLKNLYGYLE